MKPYEKIAVEFASALIGGNFARAHALLTPALQRQMTPEELRENLYAMFRGYADSEPKRIHFDEEFSWEDSPTKLPGDIGKVYVGISGDDFVEAVTVTVADVEGRHHIREIKWGRP